MWERFTQSSKKAIKYATEEARIYLSPEVDTEHLLLGLLRDEKAFAMTVLVELEVPVEKLRDVVVAAMEMGGAKVENTAWAFSDLSKEVLEVAYGESRTLRHGHIGTEHLLLSMTKVQQGKAARHLRDFGVTYSTARGAITSIIRAQSSRVGKVRQPSRRQTLSSTLGDVSIDRFSTSAIAALVQTMDLGMRAQVAEIDLSDCFLGLLREPASAAGELLGGLGIDLAGLQAALESALTPDVAGLSTRVPAPQLLAALRMADAVATEPWPLPYITTVHLLYGLVIQPAGDFTRIAAGYGLTAAIVAKSAPVVLQRLDATWLPVERMSQEDAR